MGIFNIFRKKSSKEMAADIIRDFKNQLNLKPNKELARVLQQVPAQPQESYVQTPQETGGIPNYNMFNQFMQMQQMMKLQEQQNIEHYERMKQMIREQVENELPDDVEEDTIGMIIKEVLPLAMNKVLGDNVPQEMEVKPLMYTADGKPYDPYAQSTPPSLDRVTPSGSTPKKEEGISEKEKELIKKGFRLVPKTQKKRIKDLIGSGLITPQRLEVIREMVEKGEL
jgi:hypothetical protein